MDDLGARGVRERLAQPLAASFPTPFGAYTLLGRLGQGGMAEVFLAEKSGPGGFAKLLAIKRILPHLADEAEMVRMFLDEARLAARLEHPNIAQLFDMGEIGGSFFIAMEYLPGQTVARVIARAKERDGVPPEIAARVAAEAAQGLHFAHEFKDPEGQSLAVVHRDVSPQNVMVTYSGRVKVLDFGVAKVARKLVQTRAGSVKGKIAYMSPEQCRGEPLDRRSDVFSLGAVLFELVSGRKLLDFPDEFAAIKAIGNGKITRPREVAVSAPPALVEVMERATAPRAEDRYQTAQALKTALEQYLSAGAWKVESEAVAEWMSSAFPEEIAAYRQMARAAEDLASGSAQSLPALAQHPSRDATLPTVPGAAPGAQTLRRRRIRSVGVGALAVSAVVLAALFLWWRSRPEKNPGRMVSVLVGDFQNSTGDPVFDGTLEPSFVLALEGTPFINTFRRAIAERAAKSLNPDGGHLDPATSLLVAAREGIDLVTTGGIDRVPAGYRISIRAVESVDGKVLAEHAVEVTDKTRVLGSVGELGAHVRRAIGDTTPESLQIAAAQTFTAGSLEAAHSYAHAQKLLHDDEYEQAILAYRETLKLDPDLGRAYTGMSVAYFNLHQLEPAQKYAQLALSKMDRMTERERLMSRGAIFISKHDWEMAIRDYTEVQEKYPAELVAVTNLAVAYCYRRDMKKAFELGRTAAEQAPHVGTAQDNVAVYALYAGDFPQAVERARARLQAGAKHASVAAVLGLAELALGHAEEAEKSYTFAAGMGNFGRSTSAAGLADLALFQGHPARAVEILDAQIPADATRFPASAAMARITRASALLREGEREKALDSLRGALELDHGEATLLAAGRAYLEAGDERRAGEQQSALAGDPLPEPQAEAGILEGERLLASGKPALAIAALKKSQALIDSWLVHFDLGRADVTSGAFAEADAELEQCTRREGESAALFLDEVPTLHLYPAVLYWRGRAQEGLGSRGAADFYRGYIALRERGEQDPLLDDARRRLSALR